MIANISSPLVRFGMFLSCVHLSCSMTNSLGLFLMVEGSKVFTRFFSLKGQSSRVVGIESKSLVNYEYILLGYDELHVLKGRTPIQCYADFMRSFKESFQDLHGETIVVSNCHIS
ncbi:hypothetical protein SUGI_1179130 [Cryptomeria japonica]|nr:hypothetical protein SUGI_1179130 [Cryptomeria japonica]